MHPSRTSFALVFLIAGLGGCSTYNYIRDDGARLEPDRTAYVSAHPNEEFNQEILSGQVRRGMNRSHVLASWGRPDASSRRVHPDTDEIDEMWVYHEDEPSRGESRFVLRFDEHVLQNIEVDRGVAPLHVVPDESRAHLYGPNLQRPNSKRY